MRRQDRRAHRDRAAACVCVGNARRDRSHGRWSASQRVAGHWRGGTARSCRSSNRLAPKGRSRVRDPCVRAAKDKRWRAHRAARPCWRQARKAPPFPGAAQEPPPPCIEIAAAADGDGLCQRPPFRAVRQLSTVDLVGSCEKRRGHFRSFVEEFFNDTGRRLGPRYFATTTALGISAWGINCSASSSFWRTSTRGCLRLRYELIGDDAKQDRLDVQVPSFPSATSPSSPENMSFVIPRVHNATLRIYRELVDALLTLHAPY